MNLLDIIIIATMVFLTIKGILCGIIREIASFVGVILGIWLAILFEPQMTDYLKSYLPSGQYLPLISFAVIFASLVFLSNLVGWALRLLFQKAFFGWADRTLGAVLAVAKGVILTYLIIVMLTFFLPLKTPLIANSKLAPLIIVSYQSMIRLISPDLYQDWKKKIVGKKKEMGEIVSDKIEDLAK